jgi:hypothetical protein
MKDKQFYEKKLHTYLARRKRTRASLKHLTKKISYLRKRIKMPFSKKTKSRTETLAKLTKRYFGHMDKPYYYKYGLENKYDGRLLMRAIGVRSNSAAWTSRIRLTKKITENSEIKSIWLNYKNYMDEHFKKGRRNSA